MCVSSIDVTNATDQSSPAPSAFYYMDDSILDPFQVKKRRRTEAMKRMLSTLKETELRAFTAVVCVESGLDRTTVRKYLEELETAGYIEIKEGKIFWKKK